MNDEQQRRTDSDLQPGLTALRWAISHQMAEHVAVASRAKARRVRQRRILGGGIAVAAGLAAVLALSLPSRQPATTAALGPVSARLVAAAKQLLPDGTVVELRDDSVIVSEITPSSGVRRVVLTRGEAHFQVAHDAARPFIVAAHGVEVRAVGTAFVVVLGSETIEVVVTQGKVALEQRSDATPKSPVVFSSELSAGERVAVTASHSAPTHPAASPRPSAISDAELAERLAWRIPRIEFSSTPLSEAIALYNRYSRTQLVLKNPDLGRLELSGVLRPDSTASLLHLLKVEFDIEAEPRGENQMVLWRR
jgi:transmembrane sensor